MAGIPGPSGDAAGERGQAGKQASRLPVLCWHSHLASLSPARAGRRDQVLFKGAGLWEHHEGKSELLPLPSTFPSFPSLPAASLPACTQPGTWAPCPPLCFPRHSRCWAGMKAGAGCWDGRLSEGRRRRRGGRGGGSANYTEQLWGLLKSRMKQRAAEASAAVGAEEPKHHREPEPAILSAGSDWGHPGNPAALSPPGTASGTTTNPAASSSGASPG